MNGDKNADMSADNVTVDIIDDDEAVRDSLAFLLMTSGFTVVSHPSPRSFLETFDPQQCGCIVTDVRMPGMSGIELLKHLRDNDNRIPVIVITGHGDIPLAVEAMKLGAIDFIEKPFNESSIVRAVTAGMRQRQEQANRDQERQEIRARLDELSGREREVLDGLVEGKPNKVIADDLGISPRTVEIYRANVMHKMRAASLSELVRMALLVGQSIS